MAPTPVWSHPIHYFTSLFFFPMSFLIFPFHLSIYLSSLFSHASFHCICFLVSLPFPSFLFLFLSCDILYFFLPFFLHFSSCFISFSQKLLALLNYTPELSNILHYELYLLLHSYLYLLNELDIL